MCEVTNHEFVKEDFVYAVSNNPYSVKNKYIAIKEKRCFTLDRTVLYSTAKVQSYVTSIVDDVDFSNKIYHLFDQFKNLVNRYWGRFLSYELPKLDYELFDNIERFEESKFYNPKLKLVKSFSPMDKNKFIPQQEMYLYYRCMIPAFIPEALLPGNITEESLPQIYPLLDIHANLITTESKIATQLFDKQLIDVRATISRLKRSNRGVSKELYSKEASLYNTSAEIGEQYDLIKNHVTHLTLGFDVSTKEGKEAYSYGLALVFKSLDSFLSIIGYSNYRGKSTIIPMSVPNSFHNWYTKAKKCLVKNESMIISKDGYNAIINKLYKQYSSLVRQENIIAVDNAFFMEIMSIFASNHMFYKNSVAVDKKKLSRQLITVLNKAVNYSAEKPNCLAEKDINFIKSIPDSKTMVLDCLIEDSSAYLSNVSTSLSYMPLLLNVVFKDESEYHLYSDHLINYVEKKAEEYRSSETLETVSNVCALYMLEWVLTTQRTECLDFIEKLIQTDKGKEFFVKHIGCDMYFDYLKSLVAGKITKDIPSIKYVKNNDINKRIIAVIDESMDYWNKSYNGKGKMSALFGLMSIKEILN